MLLIGNRNLIQETDVGEVVVYNVRDKDIPIVHRVVRKFGEGYAFPKDSVEGRSSAACAGGKHPANNVCAESMPGYLQRVTTTRPMIQSCVCASLTAITKHVMANGPGQMRRGRTTLRGKTSSAVSVRCGYLPVRTFCDD